MREVTSRSRTYTHVTRHSCYQTDGVTECALRNIYFATNNKILSSHKTMIKWHNLDRRRKTCQPLKQKNKKTNKFPLNSWKQATKMHKKNLRRTFKNLCSKWLKLRNKRGNCVTHHGNILQNYELTKTRKHRTNNLPRAPHSAPHFELAVQVQVVEQAPVALEQLGLLQQPL